MTPSIRRTVLILTGLFLLHVPSLQVSVCGQTVRKIEILNADIIEMDEQLGKGAQRLLGNVAFRHEDAIMNCDSAYFYSKTYSLDAFSNVKIEQGDTLFVYGDILHYEGESKIAKFRKNVKLVDGETVLVTDYMDYNRETEIAYYLNGGVITEEENTLRSDQGYYYTETEIFFFKDSVVIVNPDYTITSDTLKYNTKTEISYFFGPTEIIGEDNYIYCESGWYDTNRDISLVSKNTLYTTESRTLKGDTLYYERATGFGRATSNVELKDTAQNIILMGNYGEYEEASDRAVLTDSALMIQVEGSDSLFMHADTLRSFTVSDSTGESRILLGYYQVKFFRDDIQGMCDSLVYIEKDSTFHLYSDPVLWSDENQLTASKIELMTRNQQMYRMEMRNTALLASREDSAKYNQIRGKEMTGHFRNNQLVQLDVVGNGQTVYYAEDQGELIGVNRAECSDLIIYLKDNKVSKVNYLVKPTGIFYPLDQFPASMLYLDGFSWREEWRPKTKKDIFRWK
jgi:lipopolysaccharide export system protein LptA